MGLAYVDIFYHHRPDPETPLEETMGALDFIVRSGRALYVGLSNYQPEQTRQAAAILRALGTPCLIHQPSYSLFNRWVEDGLLDTVQQEGIGCIVFSPLFQGLLTDKYLGGIPQDSRAGRNQGGTLKGKFSEAKVELARRLDQVAQGRGQKLSQMALSWVLRQPAVTSALIGASRVGQIEDAVGALAARPFTAEELAAIEAILRG
jgi:L-glyceraldehyde 3-phosphate reductase